MALATGKYVMLIPRSADFDDVDIVVFISNYYIFW